ncbi:16S rRNA (guanine(527)-N(7))-methyltransferase RsmG [Brevibacillus dissolubilis]|uniref:16S rRNA (guanine(527)-N(7))-methyltransferase RsmG n=1 Tax=Brevibacillus dissolubilis TaxID=1844116 RepID=UPI0011172049|nr:16S rRNA (guanine(527)-N(7))-methyltransferase RsmG [Brevibacillus dissolubilis]
MGKEQFVTRLQEKGIELSPEQLNQFDQYYRLLVEWNEKMNLTGITEEDEVYTKHFYDSVSLAFYVPLQDVTKVADIGGGAGFPSIPLKICFPHLEMTIIDSLQKRMNFLEHVGNELGLTNLRPYHSRAEEAGQDKNLRESFDLVTARAVARLNLLSEFCMPFAKVGGMFVAMKGSDVSFELNEAKKAIKTLGGKTRKVETFQLPDEAGERNIVIIDKLEATPKAYPRRPGVPAKKPLV